MARTGWLPAKALVIPPDRLDEVWGRFNVRHVKSDGCWTWTGAINRATGRPEITISGIGRCVYAYRLSWALHRGAVPEGMSICHHCDNPVCVRPDHLFLGTQRDNSLDMWHKGRGLAPPPSPLGIAHHMAYHPDEFVRSLREQYATGRWTIRGLARHAGVSGQLLTTWLEGSGRLTAGGPIDPHLAALHVRRAA